MHGDDPEGARESRRAIDAVARIRELSDEKLCEYFQALTDDKVIVNVTSLELLREEMRRRGLLN